MSVLHAKQELSLQVIYQECVKLVLQEHILSQFLKHVLFAMQDICQQEVHIYVLHVHLENLQINKEVHNVQIVQQANMLQNQQQLNVIHALLELIHLLALLFVSLALKEHFQLKELLNVQIVQLEHIH